MGEMICVNGEPIAHSSPHHTHTPSQHLYSSQRMDKLYIISLHPPPSLSHLTTSPMFEEMRYLINCLVLL